MFIQKALADRPYETKVRRTFWSPGIYIVWEKDGWYSYGATKGSRTAYDMTPADLTADTWEKFE